MAESETTLPRRVSRMLINVLTCLGAGIALVGMFEGFKGNVRQAWFLLMIALLIDAADGSLVRALGLKSVCPEFDGDRLDEYADLMTFVIAPVGIALSIDLLPSTPIGLLTAVAVVGGSCLQFSYEHAKTTSAFWGFPSYWNVVFFYGWALNLSSSYAIIISWVLVIALFLPIPFIYPSRTPKLRWLTNGLAVIWGIAIVVILIEPTRTGVVIGSLAFPVYYVVASLILHSSNT